MKSLNSNPYEDRKKRIGFAVGLATIDGKKPTAHTQNLL